MALPITFTNATVIMSEGPDTILLESDDLPNPQWPFEGNASLKLTTTPGSGKDYVRKHFGMEPIMINTRVSNKP